MTTGMKVEQILSTLGIVATTPIHVAVTALILHPDVIPGPVADTTSAVGQVAAMYELQRRTDVHGFVTDVIAAVPEVRTNRLRRARALLQ